MSSTCVSRSTAGLSRWRRSPTPVSVGAKTRCPAFCSRSPTRRQHQPPCQAPCTRTKVLGGLVQPRQHELAMTERLGRGEPPVVGAEHALEQLVARLIGRELFSQEPRNVAVVVSAH